MNSKPRCAYCGRKIKGDCSYCDRDACTKDHVIPAELYPLSMKNSRVQRITVKACCQCNKGWSDDEPHFRSMLLMSGDQTPVVNDLWYKATLRSFAEKDGRRRAHDLFVQILSEGERYKVYPGRDERVLRIVRKVVRGLCHYHNLISRVPDEQVWAHVQKYEIPPAFLIQMTSAHVEEDVLQYRFGVIEHPDIHSCWLLRFFTRTPFFCIVYRRPQTQS